MSAFINVNPVGCFSILPATELVPGDIVEVGGTVSCSYNDFLLVL